MLFRAYLGPFGTFLSPKSTPNSQKVKTWVKKEEKKGDVPVKATVGELDEVSAEEKQKRGLGYEIGAKNKK